MKERKLNEEAAAMIIQKWFKKIIYKPENYIRTAMYQKALGRFNRYPKTSAKKEDSQVYNNRQE